MAKPRNLSHDWLQAVVIVEYIQRKSFDSWKISFNPASEFRKFLGIAGDGIDHGNWSVGINLHHNENYCTDKQEKTIGT